MPKVQGYKQVYLNEMMEMLDDGENRAKEILSSFSCPLNPDVEDFLRHKAIDFARQGIAQTVLVFASHKQELALLGYYTLANKVIFVPKKLAGGYFCAYGTPSKPKFVLAIDNSTKFMKFLFAKIQKVL